MRPDSRSTRAALLMVTAVVVTGCKLLEVDSPLRVPAGRLDDPALAVVLTQSAIGDFECAFGNYVAKVANVTDEFAASAATANTGLDRRVPTLDENAGCATLRTTPTGTTYIPLSTARYQADDTFVRLQGFPDGSVPAPGKTVLMATM